jgi:Cu(I)/Ag(I) efflux system membrane protein CusA/SilA
LKRVLVPTMEGAQIPLAQLADIELVSGPGHDPGRKRHALRLRVRGLGRARRGGVCGRGEKLLVREKLVLPTGYSLVWSGQYENMFRVRERLKVVVPITVFLIFLLLYMNTKSTVKAGIVMLAVPFSIIGAVWYLWILDYNVSIAVWVGMIALMGWTRKPGCSCSSFWTSLSNEQPCGRAP